MKLTVEKKTIIFIGGLIIFSVGIILFVVWPSIKNIKTLHRQTYDLRLFLEKKFERSSRLHSALATIRRLNTETATYTNHVFHSGDEIKLITTLEKLAAAHRVSETIKHSNLDSKDRVAVELDLEITGAYRDVFTFLNALEKQFPYFVIINTLNIAPEVNKLNPAVSGRNIRMDISLNIYAQ